MSWMKVVLILGMLLIGAAVLILGGESIGKETMAGIVGLIGVIVGGVGIGSRGLTKLVVVGALCTLVLGGCMTGGEQRLPGGTAIKGQPVSTAEMDSEGHQSAAFQGAAPSQVKADAGGIWSTMQGPHATIAVNPATGELFLTDPKNTQIGKITITPNPAPGEPSIVVENLNANQSDVVAVYAGQFADAMTAMVGMTQEQARVWVATAEQAGEVLPAVAETLLRAFVPTLPTE